MSNINIKPKKVLVVQYSQSGQLTNIINNIQAPLDESEFIEIHKLNLVMQQDFPFPWPFIKFFNVFPECVYLAPPELERFDIELNQDFDLVILAYQVWFLSPSLPATAFLQCPEAKNIFNNSPVITVIGCRNMWTQAQQTVKQILNDLGAKLIDNIVFIDQGSTLATFITTPRWLLTGKKESFWGLPAAGVSELEIKDATRFGHAIVKGLSTDQEKSGRPLLSGLGAVRANTALIQSEKIGYRSFRVWGQLLRWIGDQNSLPRKLVLFFYILFLIVMILTIVPVLLLIRLCLRPLHKNRSSKLKEEFEKPSGSSVERMKEFTCQN